MNSTRSRKSFLIDSLLEERQRQLEIANQSSTPSAIDAATTQQEEEPEQLDAFDETDEGNEAEDEADKEQADLNGNEEKM